jgi:hypothetical protein
LLYRLETFIKRLRVTINPRSKAYEGNACRKILRQFRIENQNKVVYNGYGSDLLDSASHIEKYAVARPLKEEEIEEMDSQINLFFNLINHYGEEAVKFYLNKTKIHMLKAHVVPFVRKFKSWGLFSEQSSESIHGIRNELDARIPGKGPEFGEKRNICFKKNRAVAFHLT